MNEPMQTVAFCDKCGRGYCYVNEQTAPHGCMDGGCWGHIRMLTTPEDGIDDGDSARKRRLDLLSAHSAYIRAFHRQEVTPA